MHGRTVAAALLVWVIARHGAGVSARTPAFGTGHQPSVFTPSFLDALSGLVLLGAWASIEAVERRFHQPRRVWLPTGLVALGISLSAPLSGHGVTTAPANRVGMQAPRCWGRAHTKCSPEAPRRSDALATASRKLGPLVTLRHLVQGRQDERPKRPRTAH